MLQLFKNVNQIINSLIGHDQTTYSDELNKLGKYLFKNKFKGVFSENNIPKLNRNQYCIVNIKNEHWLAMVNDNLKNTYVYDSFGRKSKKILPEALKSGNGIIYDTDYNPEQKYKEMDCGQKCLTFICLFDNYGKKITKFI